MDIKLRKIYKDSNQFISAINFLSLYYYELSLGYTLPTNENSLKDFDNSTKEFIVKFIEKRSAIKNREIVLKELNEKIFSYYENVKNVNFSTGKSILNTWRSEAIGYHLKETDYYSSIIKNKIHEHLALINLDKTPYQEKLRIIEEHTNPNKAFSDDEIKLIDPKFYTKTSILNNINKGNICFKKSYFIEALELYENAIVIISAEKEIENLHLYYYSWVLHQIGNVYFVFGDFDKAKHYFNNSYAIKTKIEELPKSFLFSTQLKILALFSFSPTSNENWDENLLVLIDKVRSYYLNNPQENQLMGNNIIADANFYLGCGYSKLKFLNKASEFYKKSIELAENNNDIPGLIRALFCLTIDDNKETNFTKLKDTLYNLDTTTKQDPYIRTIFKFLTVSEVKSKLNFHNKLKKVFLDNKIDIL